MSEIFLDSPPWKYNKNNITVLELYDDNMKHNIWLY